MVEPDTAPAQPASPARHSRVRLALLLLIALVLGVGGGLLVGARIASADADRADADTDRASEQEDTARDRRELLDARLQLIDEQTKPLPEVATTPPLLASGKTTQDRAFGERFTVDGGEYEVAGVEVVDEFASTVDDRPASLAKDERWALVDVSYRNRTREDESPTCGTLDTVHVVLEDGTTRHEPDFEPPVHPRSFSACDYDGAVPPGTEAQWVVPIAVPEDARIAGVLVSNIYARSSDSEFEVQGGKAGWIALDEPLAARDGASAGGEG